MRIGDGLWPYLLLVAAGGALGSVLRFLLATPLNLRAAPFPWGTLAVNLLGCLAIGLLYGFLAQHPVQHPARLLLLVGLLGAFTTYSAFALETVHLLARELWGQAALNLLLSNVGGIGAAALGLWLARLLISPPPG